MAGSMPGVLLDGVPYPNVELRPEISVDVTELREGEFTLIRLSPGPKRYKASLVTRSPIPSLDSQLQAGVAARRFTVGANNARTFHNCLVAGLGSEGPGDAQRLVYALRCEDFTP
jgi:hypothetical protein